MALRRATASLQPVNIWYPGAVVRDIVQQDQQSAAACQLGLAGSSCWTNPRQKVGLFVRLPGHYSLCLSLSWLVSLSVGAFDNLMYIS
jgi:hypothetical protein